MRTTEWNFKLSLPSVKQWTGAYRAFYWKLYHLGVVDYPIVLYIIFYIYIPFFYLFFFLGKGEDKEYPTIGARLIRLEDKVGTIERVCFVWQ